MKDKNVKIETLCIEGKGLGFHLKNYISPDCEA